MYRRACNEFGFDFDENRRNYYFVMSLDVLNSIRNDIDSNTYQWPYTLRTLSDYNNRLITGYKLFDIDVLLTSDVEGNGILYLTNENRRDYKYPATIEAFICDEVISNDPATIEPFAIDNVIFNDPATVVFWVDGTKTIVKAHDEKFDPEKGLAMAIAKKALGNKGNYYDEFKEWLIEDELK